MRTTKTDLNNLVRRVAELSGMPVGRIEAIEKGVTSYLLLDGGYKYYNLAQIQLPNGTHYVPFKLSHHSFKAGEMATMLRGLIAGLTVGIDNGAKITSLTVI